MRFQAPKYFLRIAGFGAFVGGVVVLKEFTGGGNYSGDENLAGKTVVVTGTNTGIGKETALGLAKRRARVIMACRDMNKCLEVRKDIALESRNKHIYCEECDLASQESVRKFAERLNQKEERVDLLINNAGVMRCKKSFTKEGIELQLGTNHMGHFLLTLLLLDKLKASAPSRVVNVSSIAHMRGQINFADLNSSENYDEAEAYAQSKLANILFTQELAERLAGSGVTCNAVHPGLVYTDIGRHMSINKSWMAMVMLHPLLWLFLKTPTTGCPDHHVCGPQPTLRRATRRKLPCQRPPKIERLPKGCGPSVNAGQGYPNVFQQQPISTWLMTPLQPVSRRDIFLLFLVFCCHLMPVVAEKMRMSSHGVWATSIFRDPRPKKYYASCKTSSGCYSVCFGRGSRKMILAETACVDTGTFCHHYR
ncbi:Retinol dehydrogenase 13 [Chionoecetes opilio]|uniref:Retinol dehydrogenase 13 n=1 Tax=Chionoecetes opilio TaxID=41210 RepID=A0A8J4YE97_CHIOP|nr:Retinol dehydrogenase 13 [Chionoecetes opilio]